MKTLTIPKIEDVDALERLEWNSISCANWPEFPGGPRTVFKAARLGECLHIQFHVEEGRPRAACSRDFDNVWEDSCVEFFCQLPGENRYRNFEFNSKGICVACSRLGQNTGVVPFSESKMKLIGRQPSVGSDWWELNVSLPLKLVVGTCGNLAKPLELRGNFYKCGDLYEQPHFLSWSPVLTPRPLFHCPEFFGKIIIL